MLPSRFRISKKATDMLSIMKGRTSLDRNILARLAIANALQSNSLKKQVSTEQDGMDLNISTLFGEQADAYVMLIRQQSHDIDIAKAVAQLVDDGLGLFSGVNNLGDLFSKCKSKVA